MVYAAKKLARVSVSCNLFWTVKTQDRGLIHHLFGFPLFLHPKINWEKNIQVFRKVEFNTENLEYGDCHPKMGA
jgi:hypothetical protein